MSTKTAKRSASRANSKAKTKSYQLPYLPVFSWVLLGLSLVLLVCTGIVLDLHGKATYFAIFHKPFQLSSSVKYSSYKAPILPRFTVHAALSSPSLTAGDIQTISLSASVNKPVGAVVQVWIRGPQNKEVFQSPSTTPFQFAAHKTYKFNYQYTIPATIPAGTYYASAIMQSADTNTDYYVSEPFASFSVQ